MHHKANKPDKSGAGWAPLLATCAPESTAAPARRCVAPACPLAAHRFNPQPGSLLPRDMRLTMLAQGAAQGSCRLGSGAGRARALGGKHRQRH